MSTKGLRAWGRERAEDITIREQRRRFYKDLYGDAYTTNPRKRAKQQEDVDYDDPFTFDDWMGTND